MSTRQIRRRCRALVRTLDIPSPFDAHQFCASLAAKRGRPIELVPMVMPDNYPCGRTAVTAERDYIFYEENAPGIHQQHIIIHEAGHLLLNHESETALTSDESRQLFPNLDPALVRRVLNRTEYSAVKEQEAEIFATLILAKANMWKPRPEWTTSDHGAEMGRRVAETLDPALDRRTP